MEAPLSVDGDGIRNASEETSSEELLGAVSRGDRSAFNQLYERFSARVFGLSLRILRSAEHAEEVAQEIFLEIWQRAQRFESARGSATSWILTMTHHRCVDRVRSTQAARARDLKDSVAGFTPDIDSVSEQVIANDERSQVRDCLETLTPLQRSAIELAYFGGQTYNEVAAHINTPLPTVKTRIRDGLIRLRDCIGVMA